MKNDTTGKAVAHIAGLILAATKMTGGICIYTGKAWHVVRCKDVKAMAASLVNQSEPNAIHSKRGKS